MARSVSNPGPLTYESGALLTALRARQRIWIYGICIYGVYGYMVYVYMVYMDIWNVGFDCITS